ncbi:MAG: lipid-A-disaccharide synthase-related protein [Candidatus Sericytochromatia bacterium]
MSARLLLLSNGSGEDRIGASLARAWLAARPHDTLQALPLVGGGAFYAAAGIPLLGDRFQPPSQGFAYLHPGKLWRDFAAGLGGHLWRSAQVLRGLNGQLDAVLAVGDIVPLLAAQLTGAPLAFVACALSDYYTGGRSCFDPVQVALLRRRQIPVFARDALTANNLRRRGVDAHALGNPMLDDLACGTPLLWRAAGPTPRPLVALLPGSHADTPANFRLLLAQLAESLSQPLDWAVLQAPTLSAAPLHRALAESGWQASGPGGAWHKHQARLWLRPGRELGAVLAQAAAAVGLAGTANEQAVGLGVPVISFATPGLQYTWAFGEAQQRLLGAGLCFLGDPHPLLLAHQLKRVLADPRWRGAAQQVAAERFGAPGGSQRIVKYLYESVLAF